MHFLAIKNCVSTVLTWERNKINLLWTKPWSNNPNSTTTVTIHEAGFQVASALMVSLCHFHMIKKNISKFYSYLYNFYILSQLHWRNWEIISPGLYFWATSLHELDDVRIKLLYNKVNSNFNSSASSAKYCQMCWVLKYFTMAIIKGLKHILKILTSLCGQHQRHAKQ